MKRLICFFLFLSLSLDGLLLTSCRSSQAALDQPATEAPLVATDALEIPRPVVQPAPPTLSNAQAKRFYQAQLEALKNVTPRKVKNSGNTTVEQTIQNVSPGAIRTISALAFVLGSLIGGSLVYFIFRGTGL